MTRILALGNCLSSGQTTQRQLFGRATVTTACYYDNGPAEGSIARRSKFPDGKSSLPPSSVSPTNVRGKSRSLLGASMLHHAAAAFSLPFSSLSAPLSLSLSLCVCVDAAMTCASVLCALSLPVMVERPNFHERQTQNGGTDSLWMSWMEDGPGIRLEHHGERRHRPELSFHLAISSFELKSRYDSGKP